MSEPAGRGVFWIEQRRLPTGEDSGIRARPRYLRLVADGGRLVPQPPAQQARVRREPVRPVAPRQSAARTPVRLTRRGRLVVTAAAVLIVGAVAMALAGAAQATGHSGATAAPGGEGVTKVLVRPGQNLWSLAERYAPDADTRLVIQEILRLNSMSTDQVQPGQVLWVPRG